MLSGYLYELAYTCPMPLANYFYPNHNWKDQESELFISARTGRIHCYEDDQATKGKPNV